MTKKLECYWYQCPCGYETPVCTGMMLHLSMYKGKIHRYKQAVLKIIGVNNK